MKYYDLDEEFRLAAQLAVNDSVNVILAYNTGTQYIPEGQRVGFNVTPQFLSCLASPVQDALGRKSDQTGIELAFDRKTLLADLCDIAAECLRRNEKIKPQFFVKAP